MVSYSVAWHPCLQPAIMASAGWSGFDTLEPARWVGGTGAMIRGLEDGLDYKDIAFVNEMSECPIQATASKDAWLLMG